MLGVRAHFYDMRLVLVVVYTVCLKNGLLQLI